MQGDIRLVGGPDERQGRVELCNNEAWGTVCHDNFYVHDATVACVQLGFSGIGELQILVQYCRMGNFRNKIKILSLSSEAKIVIAADYVHDDHY